VLTDCEAMQSEVRRRRATGRQFEADAARRTEHGGVVSGAVGKADAVVRTCGIKCGELPIAPHDDRGAACHLHGKASAFRHERSGTHHQCASLSPRFERE